MNNELTAIFARIPAWAGAEPEQVERIAGLTNTNFRLTVNGESYVLRISGKNTPGLGINRQHEAVALENAAAQGLGPAVVAALQPEGHLVTRWVDGRHWDSTEFRTLENVRLLTRTVKRIHALPPNGAIFSPFRRVEAYIETARSFAVPFPSGFERFIDVMRVV
jgi:thiamine kinase